VILLRRGSADNGAAVGALLAACDMEGSLDPCECLIAEDGGRLAGLARVERAGGVAYLRPVAVAPGYRGRGTGRMLVDALARQEGELRVVARGSASGFYTALAFAPLAWERVDPAYQAECEVCPDLEECRPVGMLRI